MIDWAQIKEMAHAIISDLTDLGPERVRWRDETEGAEWADDPVIYLAIRDVRTLGSDEELRENALTEDGVLLDVDQTVVISAQKLFTLSLQCESFSQDVSDGRHAGAILDKFVTRLSRSTTIERLRGIFAVTDSTPPLNIGVVDEDRKLSVYAMDLFCATVDNDLDDSAGSGGFIDEIEIEGIVDDAGTDRAVNLDIKGDAP